MTSVRTLFFATLTLLFAAIPILADERLDLMFDKDGNFAPFESKSAHEMMPDEEYSRYLIYLNALECQDAESLLNAAFVRTYPEFVVAREPADDIYDTNHGAWQFFAQSMYDELGFCIEKHEFITAEADLKASGQPSTPYRHTTWQEEVAEEVVYDNSPLARRDWAIGATISSADVDHPPARVMLSELVRRGDLITMGAELEYFLLARACHLGTECTGHHARLSELASRLDRQRRCTLDGWAQLEDTHIHRMMLSGNLDDVAKGEVAADACE